MNYIVVLKGIVKHTSSWVELQRGELSGDKLDAISESESLSNEVYQGMRKEDAVMYFGPCCYKPSDFAALKVDVMEIDSLQLR